LFSLYAKFQTSGLTFAKSLEKRMTTSEEIESNLASYIERVLDIEENPRTDFLP
jgi:hypothetical protein